MVHLKNSLEEFQKENDELLLSFLSKTFYRGFRDPDKYPNYSTVEIYLDPACNLKCKYCYLNRFGKDLYNVPNVTPETLKNNARIAIKFLEDIGFKGRLEIFAGEPLVKDYVLDIIEEATDRLKTVALIPTNMTFLLSEYYRERVEKLLSEKKINLSASVDGKYLQNLNRPGLHNLGDEFWDDCFSFAKKWNIGFHPMIYSNGIELWQKNFLWFMEQFKKYGIDPVQNLYLLEVRNQEWNANQVRELYKFMRFLVSYSFHNIAGGDLDRFTEFILKHRGFNILSNWMTRCGRGLGCSIQASLTIRIGDLAIVPCHRTSYNYFIAGYLKLDKDKIRIEAKNPELFIAINSAESSLFPYCESCLINKLCSKGCLGSQYEVTGDVFTPIPTVCMLEHGKIVGLIDGFKDVGALDHFLPSLAPDVANQIRLCDELWSGMKKH